MAEEDTGSTDLPITLDAGNGNEPPPKLAASADISGDAPEGYTIAGGTIQSLAIEGGTPEGGTPEGGAPAGGVSVTDLQDIEEAPHAAHSWLDTLLVELRDIDEVVKNRLHHIVEKIRETL